MNTQPQPKRLYRSRDRVLAGVCSGIGRYFNVDPIVVRIVALVGLLLGGASLVAYVAALILVPNEPAEGEPEPPPGVGGGRSTGAIVAIVAVCLIAWPLVVGGGFLIAAITLPFALLALAGILAWWLVSGEGPGGEPRDVARRAVFGVGVLLGCLLLFLAGGWAAGTGSGAVAAGLVIAGGVLLVIGAFTRTVRWIALPATALALGVGLVSAAGLDLDGGIGEREYRPATATDVRDRYQLGMGELVVDLRDASLPAGDTHVKMKLGMGQALLVVPRDVCVTARAEIGAGHVDVLGREGEGVDVDFEDSRRARAGRSRVVVHADVGFGEFAVSHDFDGFHDHDGPFDDGQPDGNRACATRDA